MSHPREEVEAAVAAYVDLREKIGAGEETWTVLATLFTDDAVYIDPAWGRIQGVDELRRFFDESMRGLEDWAFPIEYTAITGDTVVIKWWQLLPGTRDDGSRYQQSGISTLVYAGDGKFSYEEDLLNMAHVMEGIVASGWRPPAGGAAHVPPKTVNRDFSIPDRT